MVACLIVLVVIYLIYAMSRPIAALVDRMHRVVNNDAQINIPGVDRHDKAGDIAQIATCLHESTIELGRNEDALIAQTAVL